MTLEDLAKLLVAAVAGAMDVLNADRDDAAAKRGHFCFRYPRFEDYTVVEQEQYLAHLRKEILEPTSSPALAHERWLKDRALAGWRWGESYDPETKTHPDMRPWSVLTPQERRLLEMCHDLVNRCASFVPLTELSRIDPVEDINPFLRHRLLPLGVEDLSMGTARRHDDGLWESHTADCYGPCLATAKTRAGDTLVGRGWTMLEALGNAHDKLLAVHEFAEGRPKYPADSEEEQRITAWVDAFLELSEKKQKKLLKRSGFRFVDSLRTLIPLAGRVVRELAKPTGELVVGRGSNAAAATRDALANAYRIFPRDFPSLSQLQGSDDDLRYPGAAAV